MATLSQTRAMLTVSEACERNKGPILEVLRIELAGAACVLEVGSGTGQHAVHFAAGLPHLVWRPSELPENLPPPVERVRVPLALDVCDDPWELPPVDAVFSANTLHIMAWSAVHEFFRGVGAVLRSPGVLCIYGPFRFHGAHTSDSNAEFDHWLRARDPGSGVRDFEALDALARAQGLMFTADHAMPANNRTLVWRKVSP
jgi:SAM-dependent methyltransferase